MLGRKSSFSGPEVHGRGHDKRTPEETGGLGRLVYRSLDYGGSRRESFTVFLHPHIYGVKGTRNPIETPYPKCDERS